MRVTLSVGPVALTVEAPRDDAGAALMVRLQRAMRRAAAVSVALTHGPMIPERLTASPVDGVTIEELAERARVWLVAAAGCEVEAGDW